MIDVIYGNEEYKIKEHLKKIIAKYNNPDVIKVDLEKEPMESLLTDAMMPSMFGNTKILIGENSYFLTGTKKTGMVNQNPDVLLKFLQEEHDAHLILVVTEESLDNRKKLVKELKKQANVTNYNQKDMNPINFVSNRLKEHNFEFDSELVKQIVNQVGHDFLVINNEIEKLALYMGDDQKLDAKIIKEVMVQNIMDTIWDLMDVVLVNDKKKTIELYNTLLEIGEDPVKIYTILANQYRLMLEVRILNDAGFTNKDIARKLAVHPYRVELALKHSRKYNPDVLTHYLEKLYELDLKVKSGKIEPVLGLNNFLLMI